MLRYGLGYIHSGHPLYEERFAKLAFRENHEIKDFTIITEAEAVELLRKAVNDLLTSTRPVRDDQYKLIHAFVTEYDYEPDHCACKDTAIQLTLDTGDVRFTDFIHLSDVLKIAENLIAQNGAGWLFRMNLPNKSRKLIARVLDRKLQKRVTDAQLAACYTRRKLWKGLLHHIHYKPRTADAERFVKAMREGPNQSVNALFQREMDARRIREAVDVLSTRQGSGALLRNLTYLLSRCTTAGEIDYIFNHIGTNNLIVLIQLLAQYDYYNPDSLQGRTFRFIRQGKLCVHREKPFERMARKSYLPPEVIGDLPFALRRMLENSCKGTLGKVFIDPLMVQKALPVQEGGGSGGFGVFNSGSVVHLNKRHIVRLFAYWTDHVDCYMEVQMLDQNGVRVEKDLSRNALVHSGYQSSGVGGAAFYIDVDMQALKSETGGKVRYLVVRLYPRRYVRPDDGAAADLDIRAGYMQRDRVSSGEIFEPRTVQNNFHVDCTYGVVYPFALDLVNNNLILINRKMDSGDGSFEFLLPYLRSQSVMNMHDLFCIMASELTDKPDDADVIVSDDMSLTPRPGAEIIHSYDADRILALLNPGR